MGGVFIVESNILGLLLFKVILGIDGLPFALYVAPFIYWIVFYYLGVYFSERQRNYKLVLSFILIVLGFSCTICEMYLKESIVGISLFSWIYSFGMILLLFSEKTERIINNNTIMFRIIVKIGEMSFGIYLTHMYFKMIGNHILHDLGWLPSFLILTLCSVLFVAAIKVLIPSKYHRILGLV